MRGRISLQPVMKLILYAFMMALVVTSKRLARCATVVDLVGVKLYRGNVLAGSNKLVSRGEPAVLEKLRHLCSSLRSRTPVRDRDQRARGLSCTGCMTYGLLSRAGGLIAVALPWLLGPGLAIGAVSNAAVSKEEFLAEYGPAAARLDEFYSNLRVSAVLTKAAWPDAAGNIGEEVVIRGGRGSLRLDRTTSQGQRPGTAVWVATPARSFDAFARPGQSSYALEDLSSSYNDAVEGMRLRCPLTAAPYGFLNIRITDLIKFDDLTVTRLERTTDEQGAALVKLHYEEHFEVDGKPADRYGWLTFYPDRCWALREHSWGTKDPNERRIRTLLDYAGDEEGVPLLKRAEYWDERGPPPLKRFLVQTFEVTELVPGPVPAKEFSLAAFGLPDIEQGAPSGMPYLIVFFGLLALVAGILLRRWVVARRA